MTTIADLVEAQRGWSLETFGPGRRTEGLCAHIAKELDEIRPGNRRYAAIMEDAP